MSDVELYFLELKPSRKTGKAPTETIGIKGDPMNIVNEIPGAGE